MKILSLFILPIEIVLLSLSVEKETSDIMGRYFDYSDWTLDEICMDIRRRIAESKETIPPKVMRHYVSIVYRTEHNCYTYSHYLYKSTDFNSRKDAEDYLAKCGWIKKIDDNFWVDIAEKETYKDPDGNPVLKHYEIREYDCEEYEDGEHHIEYSEEEKKALSQTLLAIETARAYMRAYDYTSDECGFGEGRYAQEVKEEIDKMTKEYTEELPEDYYESE